MYAIAKLCKFVITSLKESHEPLAALYYLQHLIEHNKLAEKLYTLLMSVEWTTLNDQLHTFPMLLAQIFG